MPVRFCKGRIVRTCTLGERGNMNENLLSNRINKMNLKGKGIESIDKGINMMKDLQSGLDKLEKKIRQKKPIKF